MPYTQRLIVASLALVLGVGFGILLADQMKIDIPENNSVVSLVPPQTSEQSFSNFKTALSIYLSVKEGRPLTGYTPSMLLASFPRLIPEDFNGAEAVVGTYEFKEGALLYSNTEVLDEVADDLSDAGLLTFRNNSFTRLGIDANTTDMLKVIDVFSVAPKTPSSPPLPEAAACTMDAKVCPDGSTVGRTGPQCEFAACPNEPTAISCTPEQRTAKACAEIYAPVCASVAVQCVTTPCDPIPKTYSNSCAACGDENVTSYTTGACEVTPS